MVQVANSPPVSIDTVVGNRIALLCPVDRRERTGIARETSDDFIAAVMKKVGREAAADVWRYHAALLLCREDMSSVAAVNETSEMRVLCKVSACYGGVLNPTPINIDRARTVFEHVLHHRADQRFTGKADRLPIRFYARVQGGLRFLRCNTCESRKF